MTQHMHKLWRLFFYALLIFSILHTVRDILQIYRIHTLISEFYVTHDIWCGTFCDYVAFPVEIFEGIASIIVLRRNKIGLLGWATIASTLFWPVTFVLP